MMKAEDRTSQKKVATGEAHHKRGKPITNSAVYKCFWVMVCSPNCVDSGAIKRY